MHKQNRTIIGNIYLLQKRSDNKSEGKLKKGGGSQANSATRVDYLRAGNLDFGVAEFRSPGTSGE